MIICVTGPMAAGKNLASNILEEMGFACVDADELAHVAIDNSKDKILAEFGQLAQQQGINLLTDDGKINRRQLGALIFQNSILVKKQEDIVFPEINTLFNQFIEQNKGKDIIINATVLYKVPLIKKVDFIIYIDAPKIKRFIRALKRDRISAKQIRQRFIQQRNLFTKYKECNADTVRVWNTSNSKRLKTKLVKVLHSFGRG